MIVVRVKNRDITAAPLGPVTAGSVGIPVKWHFGPEWDGLAKIAVFRVGEITGQEMAVLNDLCTVPHELLAQANAGENLFIGVYGRSPALDAQGHYTVIMPTVWTHVRISEAPDPHDVDPEPTPGWEAQLQAAADEAIRIAGEAYDKMKPLYMRFWIDENGHLRHESVNVPVVFYLENGHFYMRQARSAQSNPEDGASEYVDWVECRLVSFDGRIASLEAVQASDAAKFTALESTAAEHESRLAAAESDIDSLEESRITDAARIAAVEGDIDSLEASRTTDEATLTALERMAYRHETRLSAAEAAIPAIQAAIPNAASVSNSGLLSVSHGETLLFSVQLPLYGGGTE